MIRIARAAPLRARTCDDAPVNLRRRAAILAGRGAGWASRVTGRGAGTQVSGRIMLAIDPDLLRAVGTADRVVTVSAKIGRAHV